LDGDPLLIALYLLFVLVLVFLNGFFVAAEFAMVKVRLNRIEALANEGNLKARFAQTILQNLNAYLSACQLGITLASLALGWVGEPAVAALLKPVLEGIIPEFAIHTLSFIIAFSIITTFHITLGEQVPKTYAIRHAESMTLWSAIPMVVFYKLMFPFIWSLNGLSNWMLRRVGVEPESDHETVHTDEEIRVIMQESHKSGYLDQTEMALMDNIFEFSETHAREIMIPRTELVCLYANIPYAEQKDMVLAALHTRFPVCDPDKDNIIGFVHIKDIMKAGDSFDDIRAITRPIMTVPESISISMLLKQMQKKHTALVLLIDEYGGTSGIVTVEDILEEIVGEIQDEFDEELPTIVQHDEWTHSVDGLLLIDEFNEYFDTEISTEDFDTIGGWVYSQVEMPPERLQRVTYENYELIVDEVDHMRISRITIRRFEDDQEGALDSVS
jgi:CBS domain containing-hemolysin-like protein